MLQNNEPYQINVVHILPGVCTGPQPQGAFGGEAPKIFCLQKNMF